MEDRPSIDGADALALRFDSQLSVYKGEGKRLDLFLSELFPHLSRSCLSDWINKRKVLMGGKIVKPAAKVRRGVEIHIHADLPQMTSEDLPQKMELDICYEDDDLLVLNKPPDLVVHPGAGNAAHTLLNGLLAYRREQKMVARAGLVHRLDKGTSGLLLVAKKNPIRLILQRQLTKNEIKRTYLALVESKVISGGSINMPIGRDRHHRLRMRAYPADEAPAHARPAVTIYRVKERFEHHTLLQVQLQTGRTHQIRCHLAALGKHICGDTLYGARQRSFGAGAERLQEALRKINRQMLHAQELWFKHPRAGAAMHLHVPMPPDMQNLIQALRAHKRQAAV